MSSSFVASDVSSDDEPLINLKISASAKKPEKIDDTPPRANGTNNKKAGGYSVNVIIYMSAVFFWFLCGMDGSMFLYVTVTDLSTDESSDNEPLIKFGKAAKKPSSLSPRKSVDTKKKGKIILSLCINRKMLSCVADTYCLPVLHSISG